MKQAVLITVGLLCLGFFLPQLARGVFSGDGAGASVAVGPMRPAQLDWEIFPQVASVAVAVKADGEVRSVVLHNALGKKVRAFPAREDSTYPVYDLPSGVYLLSLLDAEGEVLRTFRFHKDATRP